MRGGGGGGCQFPGSKFNHVMACTNGCLAAWRSAIITVMNQDVCVEDKPQGYKSSTRVEVVIFGAHYRTQRFNMTGGDDVYESFQDNVHPWCKRVRYGKQCEQNEHNDVRFGSSDSSPSSNSWFMCNELILYVSASIFWLTSGYTMYKKRSHLLFLKNNSYKNKDHPIYQAYFVQQVTKSCCAC